MNTFERIHAAWIDAYESMMTRSVAFRRMAAGTMTRSEYCAILRQIFHQVREHPQALGVFSSRLRGDAARALVPMILKHASSEAGHDDLAVEDMRTLGVDVSRIRSERPLPTTSAILGFMHYQLSHENPIGFLGYIFHLEFLPTRAGAALMRALESAGIPPEAQTFLRDHAEIDVAHNKLMERYVSTLVRDEADLEAVCYVARATAHLYGQMFDDAIAEVRTDDLNQRASARTEITLVEACEV